MTRDDINYLFKVIIFIALVIVAIRFFIYLLPFIIVALLIMLVYNSYKRHGYTWRRKQNNTEEITEAEIIEERKND